MFPVVAADDVANKTELAPLPALLAVVPPVPPAPTVTHN
jgi:hypothetical protein